MPLRLAHHDGVDPHACEGCGAVYANEMRCIRHEKTCDQAERRKRLLGRLP